ncbi:hypothetical protein F5Y18DRAFT_146570 [Xylariaceae sp. FL1019]|nr:hypothetical protein F5Y18DRAFT_146570 [Xylariaceae sp. FL1019]
MYCTPCTAPSSSVLRYIEHSRIEALEGCSFVLTSRSKRTKLHLLNKDAALICEAAYHSEFIEIVRVLCDPVHKWMDIRLVLPAVGNIVDDSSILLCSEDDDNRRHDDLRVDVGFVPALFLVAIECWDLNPILWSVEKMRQTKSQSTGLSSLLPLEWRYPTHHLRRERGPPLSTSVSYILVCLRHISETHIAFFAPFLVFFMINTSSGTV